MLKMLSTFRAFILIFIINTVPLCYSNDILGCGGFVKSHASLDFSKIEIGLYTKEGSLKEKTECAPTNGYYFLPLYEKGEYVLRVHPPAGWSFEPSEVELLVDGETDPCSTGEDVNFVFNGFGITGRVLTAGQKQGPSGIQVQLVNEQGDTRHTISTVGGDFHFTPVIPGKYIVKASHPRWKLDPAQTVVQVKEGNTALPVGSLAVKGYDVSGSVTSFGSPIPGVYVLLYSVEENPKFRVEGCKTALLQGVPDSPICYSVTDNAGEFKFGLVPAGDYRLLALSKSPGQTAITYNIKPDAVPFSVRHDSLYIRNAFEISGFTVQGAALSGPGGGGVQGARVSLAGTPVGTTDSAGTFTLAGLKPGTYTLYLQHAQCEFDELPVTVTASGVSAPLRVVAARWEVCGELTPPESRSVLLRATDRNAPDLRVQAGADGKWCTFLAPGVYSAKVEVSEQEQRDGLQFYPQERPVSVARAAVRGVSFGQVRARVRGRVLCGARCDRLRVALRPLAADGAYAGPPRHAPVVDGEYTFEEVVPGSVEVSVSSERLCWAEAAHNVAVTQELPPVPDFELRGLALLVTATHRMQVTSTYEEVVPGSVEVSVSSERLCWAEAAHNVAVTQELPPVPDFELRGLALLVTATHRMQVTSTYEEVVPGSVEVSVSSERLCWAEAAHNVAVTQELPPVPDFELRGLALLVTATHRMQVTSTYEEVVPGSVEVSVSSERLCWAEAAHNVAVTQELPPVPDFELRGLALLVTATHRMQVTSTYEEVVPGSVEVSVSSERLCWAEAAHNVAVTQELPPVPDFELRGLALLVTATHRMQVTSTYEEVVPGSVEVSVSSERLCWAEAAHNVAVTQELPPVPDFELRGLALLVTATHRMQVTSTYEEVVPGSVEVSVSSERLCWAEAAHNVAVTQELPPVPDFELRGLALLVTATHRMQVTSTYEEVVPGSVEVSVSSERLCWAEAAHNVAVTQELPPVPDFELRGLALLVTATHRMQVTSTYEEVVPGSVEVSVSSERLCWAEAAHNVAVTQELPPVPDFELRGLALLVTATHRMQVTSTYEEVVPGSVEVSVSSERLCWAEAAHNVAVTQELPPVPDFELRGLALLVTATHRMQVTSTYEEVVPGSVEVSVSSERLCWAEAAHNVAVTQELPPVPDFELRGLALLVTATHRMQLEYKSEGVDGVLSVPAGQSRQCVPLADQYTLTPRGCHRVQPPEVTVAMDGPDVPSVSFVATAHAAVIRILSPEPATDVLLQLRTDGQPGEDISLKPSKEDGGYVYEHTVYLAEGEVTTVTPQSSHLLFTPRGPQRLVGGSECQPQALSLRAAKALTLRGRIVPAVADVTVTLEGDDVLLTQTTGEDGVYSFGPLDATLRYKVTAHKDSYVFSERADSGDIRAHKLAEIAVRLLDDADETPLEGALVSVSGGSFRRNVASGPTGSLRFGALSPAQYYVKPNMKEYRFQPPHSIVPVEDGRTHELLFRGVRVAWSALGRAVSLGGAGAARVPLRARAASPEHAARCPQQDATTSPSGDFRIRGLLPNCEYVIELKESSDQELAGIELVKAPPPIQVKEKDVENIRLIVIQPNQLTDTNVLVHAPNVDHYKTLRLTLAPEAHAPHSALYSTKLDPTGYSQDNNPGLMYVLPRLPADNKTYVLQLSSTLSKVTHSYDEHVYYFNSDGKFRHFDIEFNPKVKSSEQELRQSSLLVLPLLAALGLLYTQRHRLPNLRPDTIKRVSRKKAQ